MAQSVGEDRANTQHGSGAFSKLHLIGTLLLDPRPRAWSGLPPLAEARTVPRGIWGRWRGGDSLPGTCWAEVWKLAVGSCSGGGLGLGQGDPAAGASLVWLKRKGTPGHLHSTKFVRASGGEDSPAVFGGPPWWAVWAVGEGGRPSAALASEHGPHVALTSRCAFWDLYGMGLWNLRVGESHAGMSGS